MSNSFIVIFKTTWAMMKKKKMQNILIGIIIMLISILLYVGVSILNQNSPVAVMFERANATENIMFFNDEKSDIDEILTWWQERDEVAGTSDYKVLATNMNYDLDGNNTAEMVSITEYVENSEFDLLYETSEVLSETPVDNEILLNHNFAKTRDLELGDTINFVYENTEYEFIVAGFVVDPQFSNPFISLNRCYVKPGFFEENDIVNTYFVGVKYNNIEDVNDYGIYEEFINATKESVIYVDYNSIISSYTIISTIIAAIFVAISLFIFTIVVFVIRSVVRNLIFTSYKQIGVKKVLGYTNKQIKRSFLWMYSIIGIIAATIGGFLGIPIRNIINKGISNDIQVGLESKLDLNLILTIFIVLILIIIFTSLATKQANAVKPIQAIKYGMPENKVSINNFNICKSRKMPLSILLAIKQMLINKKKTITTVITITILIYVAFIINSSAYSLGDSENLVNNLFGLKVGDVAVTNNDTTNSAEFIEILESIESVESVIAYEVTAGENTDGIEEGETVSLGTVTIYGNYPSDGLKLTSGREPENDFEIVISSEIVKKTGKTTGDYLIVTENEEETKFFISGTVNTIFQAGTAYIRFIKDIPENVVINSGVYWIYSKDEYVILEEMETKIRDLVDDEIIVSEYDSEMNNVLSTMDSFPMVMKTLLIVFMIIAGVIILNFTIMDIQNSTRAFGIMKAIGYSSRNVTNMLIIKSILVTTFGVLLGFVLNLLTADLVMQGILGVTPFSYIKLPILFDCVGSIIMMILFITIAIVATLIPARRISKISPKILMTE